MTWTIMMTQKELCIKPYGFLVGKFFCKSFFTAMQYFQVQDQFISQHYCLMVIQRTISLNLSLLQNVLWHMEYYVQVGNIFISKLTKLLLINEIVI